jgi:hypothetical protein
MMGLWQCRAPRETIYSEPYTEDGAVQTLM